MYFLIIITKIEKLIGIAFQEKKNGETIKGTIVNGQFHFVEHKGPGGLFTGYYKAGKKDSFGYLQMKNQRPLVGIWEDDKLITNYQ